MPAFVTTESLVQTNLWLVVNPNIVCPIKYSKKEAKPPSPPTPSVEVQAPQSLSVVDEPVQKKCHRYAVNDTWHPGPLNDASSGSGEEYQYQVCGKIFLSSLTMDKKFRFKFRLVHL